MIPVMNLSTIFLGIVILLYKYDFKMLYILSKNDTLLRNNGNKKIKREFSYSVIILLKKNCDGFKIKYLYKRTKYLKKFYSIPSMTKLELSVTVDIGHC